MKCKFLTLNMWEGRLLPVVIAFLQQQDADIVTLQEVFDGRDPSMSASLRSLQMLRDQLDYPYIDFAPGGLDHTPEGKVEWGNAVLSKFPIIQSCDTTFFNEPYSEREDPYDPASWPTTPRLLQQVVLDVGGTAVDVFNIHGVWDLDGDNFSERRRHMAEVVIDAVQGKTHAILAGDTNAKPTNQAIRMIEKVIPSVFGTELPTTFNMKQKTNPGYATASVDMILTTPQVAVLSKTCQYVDISDHLPLVAEFDLK